MCNSNYVIACEMQCVAVSSNVSLRDWDNMFLPLVIWASSGLPPVKKIV